MQSFGFQVICFIICSRIMISARLFISEWFYYPSFMNPSKCNKHQHNTMNSRRNPLRYIKTGWDPLVSIEIDSIRHALNPNCLGLVSLSYWVWVWVWIRYRNSWNRISLEYIFFLWSHLSLFQIFDCICKQVKLYFDASHCQVPNITYLVLDNLKQIKCFYLFT